MNEKSITFKVDESFHKEIKVHIAKNQITLKDYVIGLIKEDLNKK